MKLKPSPIVICYTLKTDCVPCEQTFRNPYNAITWIIENYSEIDFDFGIIYFDEPFKSIFRDEPPSVDEIEFKDFDKFIEALNRYDAG